MNIERLQKNLKKQDFVFFSLLAACALFLLWKAQYGYFFNDEPFILTLGHRMLQGDKLFVHEWNMAQLAAFFVVPFMKLYTLITGSMEGIILYFRYSYVLLHILTAVVLYGRLKRYGLYSIFAVLYYFMFTPLDTMSITYNAVALASFVLFATYFLTVRTTLRDIMTGIILAAGVLASPYGIIVYFIYALAVITVNFTGLNRKSIAACPVFNFRSFLGITVGAACIAGLFFLYLLFSGIDDAVFFLRYLLSNGNGGLKMGKLLRGLVTHDFVQVFLGTAVLVASAFDRKKYERRLRYFSTQFVLWVIAVAYITTVRYMRFNVVMLPICILGLQAFILTQKKDINLFVSLWMTGIVFALVSSESSDTGILVFSMATVVSGISSIIFISQFASELENYPIQIKKKIGLMICAIFLIQMGSQSFLRLTRTYWDELIIRLDTRISCGSGQGIKTTNDQASRFEDVYDDLQLIRRHAGEGDDVLVAWLYPSAYLDLDMDYGTFSSWTYYENQNKFDEFMDQLSYYYEMHPEKFPEYIYMNADEPEQLQLLDQVVDLDRFEKIAGKRGFIFFQRDEF